MKRNSTNLFSEGRHQEGAGLPDFHPGGPDRGHHRGIVGLTKDHSRRQERRR